MQGISFSYFQHLNSLVHVKACVHLLLSEKQRFSVAFLSCCNTLMIMVLKQLIRKKICIEFSEIY